MGRVKGGKISSKIAFIRDQYGDSMVPKVLGAMSERDQLDLKIVLETGWYPIALYDRLVVAICKAAAGGDERVYERIGYHSADLAFTTTYKTFRGKSPADLFEKMISMHAMRNDPAEMKIVSQNEQTCTVRIYQPQSTPALCKLSGAFYVRALELCGQNQVKVKETSCSGMGKTYCQFEIGWN